MKRICLALAVALAVGSQAQAGRIFGNRCQSCSAQTAPPKYLFPRLHPLAAKSPSPCNAAAGESVNRIGTRFGFGTCPIGGCK